MNAFTYRLLFYIGLSLLLIRTSGHLCAQEDILIFNFNQQQFTELNNKSNTYHTGISLTKDRFGNERSAIQINGHANSYFSLGTGQNVKPSTGTISLWINLTRRVYNGKGYDFNPILNCKNRPIEDFCSAISIYYEPANGKIAVNTTSATSTDDSVNAVAVFSEEQLTFNIWHHIVVTIDDHQLALYVDGKLQGQAKKNFKTTYWPSEQVLLGHSGNLKNHRFSEGAFDDIYIYNRVLTSSEIEELYKEENPNWLREVINTILKYALGIFILSLIIIYFYLRIKKKHQREQETAEQLSKIADLEVKAIKSQMNPHFMSNCLAAIQQLIYDNQVEKAAQYLAKFSYFLRQVLVYSDRTYITLDEELTLLRLNVELEQLRFKNGFDIEITIDPAITTSDVIVPSIITQPFIENAIWHGLIPLKYSRRPKLIIRIKDINKSIFLEIEDNGVGRTNSHRNSTRISKGLELITEKLELLNIAQKHNNYTFEIIDLYDDQKVNCGTLIRIQLIKNND